MRPNVVWLVLTISISACAGGPPARTDAELAALDPAAEPVEIRLLSVNVWTGLDYDARLTLRRLDRDRGDRYGLLLQEIRRLDPDVIAIQEATPHPAYADRLAEDLGYSVVMRLAMAGIRLGPIGIPTNLCEGGAILVKGAVPFVDLSGARLGGCGVVSKCLSFHTGEITQVVSARTVLNGKTLHLYSVHLHNAPPAGEVLESALNRLRAVLTPEEVEEARRGAEEGIARRRQEIARLIEHIEETRTPGAPAIILGDFNTTVASGELRLLLDDRGWRDSRAVAARVRGDATWDPARNPNHQKPPTPADPYNRLLHAVELVPARIDLILLSPEIPPSAVVANEIVLLPVGGKSPSDHFGVLTTLRW